MSRLVDKVQNEDLSDYQGGKKLPIIFCFDTSQSMNTVVDSTNTKIVGETLTEDGRKVNLVSGGVTRFQKIKSAALDGYAALRADKNHAQMELAVVTFNDEVQIIEPYRSLDKSQLERLLPDYGRGQTKLGEAVSVCLDLALKRKEEYREQSVSNNRPWIILFTDGEDRGDTSLMEEVIARANRLENEGQLMMYCIGINDKDLNLETLRRLNNQYRIYPIDVMKHITSVFTMLTEAMRETLAGNITNPKLKLDEHMSKLIQ